MASGQNPGEIPVGNKKLVLLIPLIGVVFVIVLVALIVKYTDPLKDEGNPKGPRPRREPPADMQHLYDGSLPGDPDPNLKDLGNGLKYRDLLEGDGAVVPDGATVACDYTGWLLDGKMFDSSWKGPKPAEFNLNGVVKGWGMGIPGMKVGGIRKLVIPPHLGYGDQGAGADIPPRATLVFEVQVLEIKDDKGGGMPPNPHGKQGR